MSSASWTRIMVFALVGCGSKPAMSSLLETEPKFVELDVPGHTPAVVSVPSREDGSLPVVVATHGAGDRAEWHCELWRDLIGDGAFVLCPQGRRMDERVPHAEAAYYYPDHYALEKEVMAAIEALKARFPGRVDPVGALYTGFSQGAIHGALVIVMHPDVFPRAVLVEGGHGAYQEWSAQAARKYRDGGGLRVGFGCGSPWCVNSAKKSATYLEDVGVSTRVAHAEGAGHSYGSTMETEIRAILPWVLEGDARWSITGE